MESLMPLLPLLAFGAAVGLVLALYSMLTGNRDVLRDRLAGYTQAGAAAAQATATPAGASVLKEKKSTGIPLLGDLPGGAAYAERVMSELAAAAVPLRIGEYLLIRWFCALFLALIPIVIHRPVFLAVPLGLLGFYLPKFYIGRKKGQRITKFNDQLCDALGMMANSMRSGSSFLQAIDLVARELPPPIGEEFGLIVAEAAVGAPIEDTLHDLCERIKSYDLFIAVTAILVQRQTGGSLAEVLENISTTIRDRIRLLRQVQVLTAEQKMSGYVVGLLPVILLVAFQFLSPTYYAGFTDRLGGKIMLGTAAVLQVAGFIAMRKVSQIDV